MTTKTGPAVAAMLALLLSTGCGRISDPAAQDGTVFEYH